MNKYQLSILAIAFSFLSFFFPTTLFAIGGIIVSIIFLWLMNKSLKKGTQKYEPYVFLGLSAVAIVIGIFVYYAPGFAFFNVVFFIVSGILSLKHIQKESNEIPIDSDKEKGIEKIQENREVAGENEGPIVDYELIISTLKKEMSQQLTDFTNQLKNSSSITAQYAKEQERFIDEVKSSLLSEVNETIASALENQKETKLEVQSKLEEELKKKYEQEVESSKSLMADLKIAMEQYGQSVEDVRKQVVLLSEKDPSQSQSEIYEEIIRKYQESLQKNRVSFTNNRHLVNNEIKEAFYRALDDGTEEVCIISPWLGKWILSDQHGLMPRFKKLLDRGATLKIAYGISNHSYNREDSRNIMADSVARDLRNKFKKYGAKFQIQKVSTHHKLLICDNSFYVQGSYNLLSNQGNFEDPSMWHEGAEYSEDPVMINTLKTRYFKGEKWLD